MYGLTPEALTTKANALQNAGLYRRAESVLQCVVTHPIATEAERDKAIRQIARLADTQRQQHEEKTRDENRNARERLAAQEGALKDAQARYLKNWHAEKARAKAAMVAPEFQAVQAVERKAIKKAKAAAKTPQAYRAVSRTSSPSSSRENPKAPHWRKRQFAKRPTTERTPEQVAEAEQRNAQRRAKLAAEREAARIEKAAARTAAREAAKAERVALAAARKRLKLEALQIRQEARQAAAEARAAIQAAAKAEQRKQAVTARAAATAARHAGEKAARKRAAASREKTPAADTKRALVWKLAEQGYTRPEIARRAGITIDDMGRTLAGLAQHGYVLPVNALPRVSFRDQVRVLTEEGNSPERIADALGVPVVKVNQALVSLRRVPPKRQA